ncbi:MAG: SET domain-containing protein-lysine N-methyltransferase, partial [Methanothrix sp.]|nr:SET domain-containing protein-lysine N-methyltransferase [Methanothrix sp.]
NSSVIDGNGIFAAEQIPLGTIVFYYSSEDEFLSKEEYQRLSPEERAHLSMFGVEDEFGTWIITDGDANHSCDANILSLFVNGIYCDIAVKDIQHDEEITLDYRLLYSSYPRIMECNCRSPLCRRVVGSGLPADARTQTIWISRISNAVSHIFSVDQPLFSRSDERAIELAYAIKSKENPIAFPYIKFSLISQPAR